MDFTYDDEQLALQEVARTALERECGPDVLRQLADDPAGITPPLWSTLVDLGWTGLLLPDEQGGVGAGLLEMCIVAEQMGRIPLPGPFFSSSVCATLACRALGATELLADLASGARRGTIALGEQGHGEPLGTVRTRARRKGAQWVLTGEKPFVVDGHTADWAVVVARSEEGVRSYLLEAPAAAAGVELELVPSLDPTRKLARLVLEDTPAVPLGPGGNQSGLWQRVQDDIAVVLAAETTGAADRALGEAIAYTSERIVFDKPVATYQTVRHRLVEMFQQVEMARAGFQFAAWASDTEAPERAQAAAMAAAYAAEAGVRVTGDDIQLHGGVGFTWANDAHFLFKRVKQNEVLAGGSGAQWHRLATLFIDEPAVMAGAAPESAFGLRPMLPELAKRYQAEGAWDDRSLGQFLHDALHQDPTRRIRIWSPTHAHLGTVGDVYEEALRVAGGLRALGLGPGDVVAFQLPNWVEAAVTFYACAMLGVTLVPIVHFYGPKEVGFILRQSRARALVIVSRIGQRDYLSELATIRDGLTDLDHVIVVGADHEAELGPGQISFEDLRRSEPIEGPVAVDPDGPALIAYTSGTTADPKGVVHTHRTLGCEVRQLAGHQAGRDRPALVGAPVGHAIGMLGGLLCPLVGGRPLYLIDGWDPPTVLEAMVEEQISAGSGSTYFFTSLLDCPGFGPEHVELMHYIGLGGSPIPDAVAERADELGISLVRSYGCTEHPSVTGSAHEAPREKRIHTDGCPLEWVEIRTVDEEGNDVGVGEAGEILSRGPDRFAGYTDPKLSDEAIDADGWFRTGDVGVIDADGYLTITDRVKDIIIRGGENVSAAEVEQLLAHMEGVAEVAVVAAPDERLGEHGCAFFRMQPGSRPPDLEAVRAHLSAAGLARQKWPEELRVVDELPRTPSGKVQKFVLRQRLRAGE